MFDTIKGVFSLLVEARKEPMNCSNFEQDIRRLPVSIQRITLSVYLIWSEIVKLAAFTRLFPSQTADPSCITYPQVFSPCHVTMSRDTYYNQEIIIQGLYVSPALSNMALSSTDYLRSHQFSRTAGSYIRI